MPMLFLHRMRGEPDPKFLDSTQHRAPTKREHELFAESCARIDARNRALGKIGDTLREAREELAEDNVRAERGAA